MTEFQTQNGTDSSPTATATSSDSSSSSSTAQVTELPTLTKIAAFTVPNGGIYTATAIGGDAHIAGRVLTVGGPDALVGGVRVSAADDGFKFGDRTAAYKSVTASSTAEVANSTTGAASSSATAESSATESASATESGDEDASATSGSESASASESSSATGGAAGGATAMSKGAFTALGGLVVLLCVFA